MYSFVHDAFVPSDLFSLIHSLFQCVNLECWLVSSCRSNCISSINYTFLLITITLLLCSMLWCSTVWLRCLGTRIPTSSFGKLIQAVFHDPLGVKAGPSFFWIQLNSLQKRSVSNSSYLWNFLLVNESPFTLSRVLRDKCLTSHTFDADVTIGRAPLNQKPRFADFIFAWPSIVTWKKSNLWLCAPSSHRIPAQTRPR